MEVIQRDEFATFASIGGGDTIAMGITDSAEFFAMLYKTIYSDQQLAVVREVMCNGWDEHIKHGRTDQPLIVSLDQSTMELKIRDYGVGIPRSLIGPIYGVMGGTTKVRDANVTGGFGIGCKSPFAYTDHFEVTSWSEEDGMKTVYTMTKSDPDQDGKPGIKPIVSVPIMDGQHGLEVKIQVKDQRDLRRFGILINRIAANGEMNVIYNGTKVSILPFSKMSHGFMMTTNEVTDANSSILLRYGNVIYPVDSVSEYANEYYETTKLLNKLPSGNWKIILQAKPNTISVTPSRETLSMSELTILTIKELLGNFIKGTKENLETETFKVLEEQIKSIAASKVKAPLFDPKEGIPNTRAIVTGSYIFDYNTIARYTALSAYPSYKEFRKKDINLRIDNLIENKFGDQVLLKRYKDAFENDDVDRFWKRRIVHPLLRDLKNDLELTPEKIFALVSNSRSYYSDSWEPTKLSDISDRTIVSCLPFLRKIVILSHNRTEFANRAQQFPILKELGSLKNTMLYTVARSPRKIKVALEFFEKRGYVILDLTKAQPWEPQEAADPISEPKIAKPKRTGIPLLGSILDNKGTINIDRAKELKVETISDPEFVITLSGKNNSSSLPKMSFDMSKWVIKNFGKQGGIVVNSRQADKYILAGAKDFHVFMLEKIRNQFRDNPRFKASMPFDYSRLDMYRHPNHCTTSQALICAVYIDQDLLKHFGLTWTLTPDDKMYISMWEHTQRECRDTAETIKLIQEINKILEKYKLSKKLEDLFEKIKNSQTARLLNGNQVVSMMCSTPPTDVVGMKRRSVCRDLLLLAIEG